ncbi:MAG: RDD family protein [Chryseolinea sp.]
MDNTDQILDAPAFAGQKLQYAGFWVRVGAVLIDGIILAVVNGVLSLVIASGSNPFLPAITALILQILYFPIMESSAHQATAGKMALGLKVGDAEGRQLSFGNALGRYFAKILSALILYIGFMMVGWDDKKQGLHDKIANTFVFYAK